MGASLLVFANKTDVTGCMTDDEIGRVSSTLPVWSGGLLTSPGTATRCNQDAQMGRLPMQCHYG